MSRPLDSNTALPRSAMACKLCGAEATLRFSKPLAHGFQGTYFQCRSCGFLHSPHLDDPRALARVYAAARADDDQGAAFRLYCVAHRLGLLARLRTFGRRSELASLDFGCGTGYLPAFLAFQAGWRAVGFDPHGTPAFTPSRVLNDWEAVRRAGPFQFVSAIEVLEHFTDPLRELKRIGSVMDPRRSFLYVTTETFDERKHGAEWIYLAQHTAQHCSFYSTRALRILARAIDASTLIRIAGSNEWLFVRGRYPRAPVLWATVAWIRLTTRFRIAYRFG